MKNLIAIFFAGSSLFLISSPIKAEWDYWARKHSQYDGLSLYTYDSSNPSEVTFRTTKCFTGFNFPCGYGDSHYVDSSTGEYWAKDGNPGAGNIWFSYDPDTDIWTNRGTGSCDTSTYYACTQRVKRSPDASEDSNGDKSIEITGTKVLEIKSMMPQDGLIFSDGIENDFLNFNSGSIAHIGLAQEKANIVVA